MSDQVADRAAERMPGEPPSEVERPAHVQWLFALRTKQINAGPASETVRVEVVQRAARVPATLGSDDVAGLTRQAELIPALALRLARQVATPLGGSAELTPLPGVGSVLQITFGQTS